MLLTKSIQFFILLIFTASTAYALPRIGEEKDFEYNIFKLGGGLVNGSIMKYSKCVNDGQITKLEELIDDSVKLDCNYHKDDKAFCNCVSTISSVEPKKEKEINEKLEKQFHHYLETDLDIRHQYMFDLLSSEADNLKIYENENFSCSSSFDYSSQEGISSKGNSLSFSNKRLDVHEYNSQHFELLDLINRAYNEIINIRMKDTGPFQLEYDVSISMLLQDYPLIDTPFNKSLVGDIISKVNSNTNKASISPEELNKEIQKSIIDEIHYKCNLLESSFSEYQNQEYSEDEFYTPQFKEYAENLTSSTLNNQLKEEFYEFVQTRVYHPDSNIMSQKRFEADIYYCALIKDETNIKDKINSATQGDQEKLDQIDNILFQDGKLSKDISDIEKLISTEKRGIQSQESRLYDLEKELELELEKLRNQTESLNSIARSALQEVELKMEIEKSNKKIEVIENQIKSVNKNIKKHSDNVKELQKEFLNLEEQRKKNSKKFTEIMGDKEVADSILRQSRKSLKNKPSIYKYDPKTKKVVRNKQFKDQMKAYKENNNSVRRVISQLKKESPTYKATQSKQVKSQKKYFSENKVNNISKEIIKAKPQNLSPKERYLQNKVKELTNQQSSINSQIKKVSPTSNNKTKKLTKSSKNLELERIKNEISDVRKQRENLKTKTENRPVPIANPTSNTNEVISKSSKNSVTTQIPERETSIKNTIDSNKKDYEENKTTPLPKTSYISKPIESPQVQGSDSRTLKSNETPQVESILTLDSDEFELINSQLESENISTVGLKEGERITVSKDGSVYIYETVFKDGKMIGFKKIKTTAKSKFVEEKKKQIIDIQKEKAKLIQHADLVNLFSEILN
jgi:hypothetical protein